MIRTAQQQLNQEYQLIEKLGQGAFGSIVSVRSRKDGKIYACKIQKNHGKKIILVEKQFLILVQLIETKKFPLVYSMKKFPQNSFVIMEKLDRTLIDVLTSLNHPFSIKTIALITQQLFSSLQLLHRIGYLHRDLKPQNIMTTNTSHQVKIIDFGLADNTAVKKSSKLIGNVRFASRGAHLGYSSKLDDLQELLYVIYFLMLGKLPWQTFTKEDVQKQILRNTDQKQIQLTPIYKMKTNFLEIIQYPETKNLIKKSFYQEIHYLAKYIFSLTPHEDPKYSIIIHKAQRMLAISGTAKGQCFDWCPKECPHVTKYSNYWTVYNE